VCEFRPCSRTTLQLCSLAWPPWLADHLGSTSLSTDAAGNRVSELRYKPWGETRFSFGTLPTKYTFTGQFSYMDDPSTQGITEGFGLMYFGARWLDPSLGRFTQPDTIIPQSQGVQAWDRYAYANNNPLRYIDPTGHMNCEEDGYCHDDDDPPATITPTPPVIPTLSPTPSETPVPPTKTPTPCSTPPPGMNCETYAAYNNSTDNGYRPTLNSAAIAGGFSIAGFTLDLLEFMGVMEVSPVIGPATSTIQQGIEDFGQQYSPGQELAHMTLGVGEGLITTAVAGSAGASAGLLLGGPENPLAYAPAVIVFAAVYAGMERSFDQFNEQKMYPWMNKNIH